MGYLQIANIVISVMSVVLVIYCIKLYKLTRSYGLLFLAGALTWFMFIRIGNAVHWDWMLHYGREIGIFGYVLYMVGIPMLYYSLKKWYSHGGSRNE